MHHPLEREAAEVPSSLVKLSRLHMDDEKRKRSEIMIDMTY